MLLVDYPFCRDQYISSDQEDFKDKGKEIGVVVQLLSSTCIR
jgi:hypothetical protein